MESNGDADGVKACTRFVVEGTAPVVRPRKTWQNTLSADMRLLKVDHQVKWRAIGRCIRGTQQTLEYELKA